MNTPIGTINRIIIYAGDTLKCAAFYRDLFGFTPLGEWTAEWAELDAGGCRLAFHQAMDESGPIRRPTGSPLNPHKIVVKVRDVEEACRRLKSHGVKMGRIHTYPELDGLTFCQGTDPEGHVFQIANR